MERGRARRPWGARGASDWAERGVRCRWRATIGGQEARSWQGNLDPAHSRASYVPQDMGRMGQASETERTAHCPPWRRQRHHFRAHSRADRIQPQGGRRAVSMGAARSPLRGAGNEWAPNARRDVLPRPGSAQKIGPKSLAWQRRKASASGGHLGFGLHPCAGRHVQLDAVEYGLFAQGFGQVEIETGF